MTYETISEGTEVPVKAWVKGVPFEDAARQQLVNAASLPIVYKWVAAMPDVHFGRGATIGSVIPTLDAIIPAAVGVDIGCGMCAVQTSLTGNDLPDNLRPMREAIEKAIPHGRKRTRRGVDQGAFQNPSDENEAVWKALDEGYRRIIRDYPRVKRNAHPLEHLGTLGSGNHFVEVCLDESDRVWFMLHSGSRGIGNRIGQQFISLAREDMREHIKNLPDANLAYLSEGTRHFRDYVFAVEWAQEYARLNRECMMRELIHAVRRVKKVPRFTADAMAVNCHHNYVTREFHYGKSVFVTRKGAVRAGEGELGIIPGSMGARSYIVRGKGNPESFESCSHGAGRAMSRGEARRRFTVRDHEKATEGVECRKDKDVIDETPAAYKDIDAVMAAQSDLVDVVHRLRQVICVKG